MRNPIDPAGIIEHLRIFPGREASFHTRLTIRRLTFAELHDEVAQATAHLLNLGVPRGARIALRSGNCLETVVADLALLNLECTTIHLPDHDKTEIAAWVVACRLDFIIAPALQPELITAADLRLIGMFSGLPVHQVASHANCAENELAGIPAVIFSSGTSGRVKKIRVARSGIVPSAHAFFGRIAPRPEDKFLIFLPLYNYQQKLLIYGCILYGLPFCLSDPESVLSALKQTAPTLFLAPPIFYETAWKMAKIAAAAIARQHQHVGAAAPDPLPGELRAYFGGHMRMMWSGMAPIAPEILQGFQNAGVPLLEAYGMTEFGPIAMNMPDENRLGSVGRPINPGSVSLAEDGEIILHSATPLTSGYLDETAAAEREVYHSADCIATGDVGERDADGFLFLKGRKKEVIITSAGVKIHPSAVESLFAGIPNINHAVLFGNLRASLGLLIMVAADLPATRPRVAEIVEQANAGICHAAPIRHVKFIAGEFTPANQMLTRNFKLARRQIAEKYEALVFAMDQDGSV